LLMAAMFHVVTCNVRRTTAETALPPTAAVAGGIMLLLDLEEDVVSPDVDSLLSEAEGGVEFDDDPRKLLAPPARK
jgi:hypothetical protein